MTSRNPFDVSHGPTSQVGTPLHKSIDLGDKCTTQHNPSIQKSMKSN
jgi:hypothetical protein